MYPLSDEFLDTLPFYLLIASCGLLFAISLWTRRWLALAPFVLCLLWVGWHLNRMNWADQYASVGFLRYSLLGLAVLLVSGIWGLLIAKAVEKLFPGRRLSGFAALATVVALPGLGLISANFIRQIVPEAACRTALPFIVGARSFRVPLKSGVRLDGTVRREKTERIDAAHFETGTRFKEDVRRLCNLTDGGAHATEMGSIWWTPSRRATENAALCAEQTDAALCAAVDGDTLSRLNSVRIEAVHARTLAYEMLWFEKSGPVPADSMAAARERQANSSGVTIHSRGTRETGSVCLTSESSRGSVKCFVWRALDDASLIRAQTRETEDGTSQNAHLRAAEHAMDFALQAWRL